MTTINLRTITVKNIVYIRADDVVCFLKEIASTEETDTRNRLHKAADGLKQTELIK